MFGSKKKQVKDNSLGKAGSSAVSHSLNTLVQGTTVEGTVRCESDIRIDGTVKGSLDCKAKVIIGAGGFVDGDVTCQNAVIEGRFEGTLRVAELLVVRETAQVNGDVKAGNLSVQAGAVFNVTCKMGSQSLNTNGVLSGSNSKAAKTAEAKVG